MEGRPLTLSLFAALLLLGCVGQTSQQAPEEIKIGYIGPLSGDGAAYGIPMQKAVLLAVKEINAAGGIDGKNITVISEDGKCNAKDAATALQKLISVDNVKVVIGGVCSGETLGMGQLATQNKVILFSPGSTSPAITGLSPYVFRDAPSDALGAKKIAEYAIGLGFRKAATINEQSDAETAYADVFRNAFTADGGTIVASEQFTSDSVDINTQVLKIKEAQPEVILVAAQNPAKASLMFNTLAANDVKAQLIGNEVDLFEDSLQASGKNAEGFIGAQASYNPQDPKIKQFFQEYVNDYQTNITIGYYLVLSRDSVYILRDAIKASGYDPDAIKDYLHTKVKNYPGLIGNITLNEQGDSDIGYDILQVVNGTPKKIG